MKVKKKSCVAMLLLPVVLLTVLLPAGCRPKAVYTSLEGEVWATEYTIAWQEPADGEPTQQAIADSVKDIIAAVDRSLSIFCDTSIVSKANRGDTVVADSLFREVIEVSQRVSALSGGRFDPTIGPLIELYGFGLSHEQLPPSQAAIDSILPLVGISGVAILADGTISKPHPDTRFNFSAVAKGYGVDLIADMLRRNGINNFMVEIGGEIAVEGLNSEGRPWQILVESPADDNPSADNIILSITSGGVATSGNYHTYRIDPEGNHIGHIIDASTGRPVDTDIISATVTAHDCVTADALATACMTMRSDKAVAMINGITEADAVLIVLNQERRPVIIFASSSANID